MNNNGRELTTGVVWKKLLVFFLPIAAGTCIQQLYNAVDGLVVGKYVGTVALAAVGGSAAQIINLIIGFFVALTTGAAVVIAQIYGAGKEEDVQKASGNAIAVCSLTGVLLAAAGIIAAPEMLKLLKTPDDTVQVSLTYLRIYFTGVPFILVLNMESNVLRSVGDSYSPFIFMLVGCVSNIIMDFAFVLWFGWGVAGVAIATVLAQIINMTLLTVKLARTDAPYKLSLANFRLRGRHFGSMMKIGIPAGLQASMYSVSNMVIQVGVNTLGTVVVASWAMTSKIDGLYWAVSNAMGSAVTTFIGQNIGAGKMDRVKLCVKQGFILSESITVAVSALIIALSRPLLGVLTDDAAVVDTTYRMLILFVPFYFTWTVIEVISAVLRGAGDAVKPVIIIGLGICFFRIIYMATVFAYFKTVEALCLAYLSSWVVTDIALVIYYRHGKWQNNNKMIAG